MQQSRHGKKSIERQAVGTDGLALPGQAWRCRAKRHGQAFVCRGRAANLFPWWLMCRHGQAFVCRGRAVNAAPGVICLKNLANATPFSNAFVTGSRPISGKNSLMLSAASRICNTPWSSHDRESAPSRPGRRTQSQAIGHSRGGVSTKILALCDALGNLLKFALMPGQRHDSKGVEEMIRNQKFGALLADKAFDVQWLIERLQAQGVPIVISQRPDRCQLQGGDLSGFGCDSISVILNRP